MARCHVVITKSGIFQGEEERWSNGYTFDVGDTAVTAAYIASLAAALITMEKSITSSDFSFRYANGGTHPLTKPYKSLYVEEFATPQSGSGASTNMHPETVVMASSRYGQKHYARKFFHTGMHMGTPGATQRDVMVTVQRDAVTSALAKLTDGTLPGGAKYWSAKGGIATAPFVANRYLRTRQFRRRGKRPPRTAP